MWSERWGESGMRSIEMKQNSGGQRDTEQWHSCEWQRLGDQSGEYSRRGVSAFDVGNADQTHHQQGLQKTTGWAGYSPPLPWQVQMMQGFWDVWMLSFWKYNGSISLLLAGSAKDTIAESRQWITPETVKNKLLHFHLCKLNQFGLLCCISHS